MELSNVLPRVSILVPVYGVERFISRCACSLFEQTYRNIEYVFVDDCSPDNSIQVLKNVLLHYPERQQQVKFVRNPVNKGLAATRNKALEYATGKYVLNVDSDDYLEREAVELLCEKAERESADVVVFDSYIDYLYKRIKKREHFAENKVEYVKLLLQLNVSPSIWSCFLNKKLYFQPNIRAVEGVNQGEDLSVTPRLIHRAHKIVKLDKCLYNYVQYNYGSYTNNMSKKSIDDMIRVCGVLDSYFKSVDDFGLYGESLILLRLRTKIYLLKTMSKSYLPEVSDLFLDIDRKCQFLLLPRERILLMLSRLRWYTLLKIYTRLGSCLRKFMRNIFGE